MKATALIRRRVILAPDAFAEVTVWRVPQPVLPSEHPYKYRLAYQNFGLKPRPFRTALCENEIGLNPLSGR